MIAHLSSEQLSECVLAQSGGQLSPMVARHIEDCPACRAELENLREALGEFRGAVRAWSEDQAKAVLAIPSGAPEPNFWKRSHQLAWALLIAAVFVLASFIFPQRGSERSQALASSDAVLLKQVDAQVSRTVPSSMEPLMKLVVPANASAGNQE